MRLVFYPRDEERTSGLLDLVASFANVPVGC